MPLLAHLIVNVLSLLVVDYLIPGVSFDSFMSAFVTAVVFGIVNTFLRPILQIIALPISLVTFGIAAFFINVSMLWLVSMIVPGFHIDSFFTAVIASVVLSLVSWFLHRLSH